jgi:hypothetical protein
LANDAIWNFQGGQILHGNSGGLVYDEKTHTMIGIPTWYIPDQDTQSPVGSRIRPIDFVKPLLAAVEAGQKYDSPYTVPHPAAAKANIISGEPLSGCEEIRPGGQSILEFHYSGFTGSGNIDVAAELDARTRNGYVEVASVISKVPNRMKSSGCVAFEFPGRYRDGSYRVRVGVGGDLHVIYDQDLTITW